MWHTCTRTCLQVCTPIEDGTMKILSIISQKGGSGKTTLALHLAAASSQKRDTAVIDLDPQASAVRWSDRRASEIPPVISAHANRLPQVLVQVEEAEGPGGALVILDTAPHSDSTALDAAKASDLILIPCRPAILDLEAVSTSFDLVQTTGTPVFVVLNGVAPRGREADDAAAAIAGLGIDVAPTRLVNRVAYARSLVTGLTAQEFRPKGKAAKEVSELHAFTCAHMHIGKDRAHDRLRKRT